MSALHAIILDFDGVIANSERLHLRAFQQALADAGSPLALSDEAYYAHYLGFDDHGVVRQLARDHSHFMDASDVDDLVAAKGHVYEALTAAGEMLYPGVAEFIRTAAATVPLAVASGAQTHEIEDVLGRAGVRHHFLAVVGADQTPASKPAPDPYLEAFARVQRAVDRPLATARTVAIEDSRWGLESARAAGLRTVAVTNTYPAAALAAYAELVVESLNGLPLGTLERLCEPAS
jgi:beta-phosphoglucomutase